MSDQPITPPPAKLTKADELLIRAMRHVLAEVVDDRLRAHGLLEEESGPYVYFIRAGEDGPIKIGVAANPAKRIRELQPGQPAKLRLLATTTGGFLREKELHARFTEWRIGGEWFEPCDDLLALIDSIKPSPIAEELAREVAALDVDVAT